MLELNQNLQDLPPSYLFKEIAKYKEIAANKGDLLDLGIGDVSLPIISPVLKAIQQATEELGLKESFQGYGPYEGYSFLRQAISKISYNNLLSPDEIFISDGAKNDSSDLLRLFKPNSSVLIFDPSYPVYVNSAKLFGNRVHYLPCHEENHFSPSPPDYPVDIIYLCSPNNPTGVSLTKQKLKSWVDYALEHKSVILFDGAYEAFIQSDSPHSIYEIEGAKQVAIEIRSFSKAAGFTSLRASYTVIPHELEIQNKPVNALWKKLLEMTRASLSYPIQKGAEAALFAKEEIKEQIRAYQKQTLFLKEGLKSLGYTVYGGIDAPYLWVKNPKNFTSWQYFHHLLDKAAIISTPGSGFGPSGEGFVRFSAFGNISTIEKALSNLEKLVCATN